MRIGAWYQLGMGFAISPLRLKKCRLLLEDELLCGRLMWSRVAAILLCPELDTLEALAPSSSPFSPIGIWLAIGSILFHGVCFAGFDQVHQTWDLCQSGSWMGVESCCSFVHSFVGRVLSFQSIWLSLVCGLLTKYQVRSSGLVIIVNPPFWKLRSACHHPFQWLHEWWDISFLGHADVTVPWDSYKQMFISEMHLELRFTWEDHTSMVSLSFLWNCAG